MNGRQSSFGISGHPLAQFLSLIVIGVVLVGAVILGAVVLVASLLAVFVIGYSAFRLRAWWRWRMLARPRAVQMAGRSLAPPRASATSRASTKSSKRDADARAARSGTAD